MIQLLLVTRTNAVTFAKRIEEWETRFPFRRPGDFRVYNLQDQVEDLLARSWRRDGVTKKDFRDVSSIPKLALPQSRAFAQNARKQSPK